MFTNQVLKTYDDLPTVSLTGVEIFAEGNWNGDKYSGDDLQAIVDAFDKVGFEPTVKAGHADGQDNLNEKEYRKVFGAPALGYVERVYRKGAKLVADLKQVPRHFANLIKAGSYKRISSEIYWNYSDEASGNKYPRVLKSIAFLGAEIPALPNLKAIEALFHKTGGRVYAYDRGREFRMYEMEKTKEMPEKMPPADGVMEKDGKWCTYKNGKLVGEYGSQAEAMKALGHKEMNLQEERYEMDEKEFQAKIDAAVSAAIAGLTKEYEQKTADAVAKAKAESDDEKKALADRVAQLEKQNQDALEAARYSKIDARLEKLSKDGKLTPAEQTLLQSIARALPEVATHAYSNGDKEVKEPVIETVFKLFENRKTSLFNEISAQGREIKGYSDAQGEVIRRANELIAKSEGKLDMVKAYAQVAKEDPDLWRTYQMDVKGAN